MDAVTVRKNGKAEMAYVEGVTPWHGKGNQLKKGSSLEQWRKASGMDWQVESSPVYFMTGAAHSAPREWKDNVVLFRSDTKKPLSVVSDTYKIVQPAEVLEFFSDLCAKNKMTMETAGTLFGGRRYWALARTGHEFALTDADLVKAYTLLASSCDGSMATIAKFTSICVVCNNTLEASMKGSDAIRVRHTSKFSETEVKMEMGLLDETWTEFEVNAKLLAKKKITRNQAVMTLVDALGDREQFNQDIKKDAQTAFHNQPYASGMAKIMSLFEGAAMGAGEKSRAGTAWGLVNAATQYFDHEAGRNQDRRLAKAWFGKNAGKKLDVLEAALQLV
jgi:phage/plasmid-like protein (TIGR03299 family)